MTRVSPYHPIMGLAFGDKLADISADEEELAAFLESAREREGAAPGGAAPAGSPDAAFAEDPAPDWGDDGSGGIKAALLGDDPSAPPKGKAPRVTVAIRKDIQAKVALFATVVGTAWERRDPHCGSVFSGTIPELSEALTDILVDSPDIVAWFTTSGRYMKWLTLGSVLSDVVGAVVSHHVTHTVVDAEVPPGPDWSQYGARQG